MNGEMDGWRDGRIDYRKIFRWMDGNLKGTYHAKSTFLALKCSVYNECYKYRKDEIILFR